MNKLRDASDASFALYPAELESIAAARVPGLMLCAYCGLDHVDPAAALTQTMRPTHRGYVCAEDGCSVREDVQLWLAQEAA